MDLETILLVCIPLFASAVVVMDDCLSQKAMKEEAAAQLRG